MNGCKEEITMLLDVCKKYKIQIHKHYIDFKELDNS